MEGIVVTHPVPAVEEPEITSAATTGLGPAEATTFDGSGGGDGSAACASCPWSLTHHQQVHNLKKNFKKALDWAGVGDNFDEDFEVDPWFAIIVAKLRAHPYLKSREFEIDESLLGGSVSELGMTSLDLAILMEDPKMVHKILERSPIPDNVILGGLVDPLRTSENFLHCVSETHTETGYLYTPLHLAIAGGNSHIVDDLLERGADVNAENWKRQTPLDLAWKLGNVTILEKLLEKDVAEGKKPIHVAIRYGDVELMKKFSSLDVNAVDKYKKTSLHHLATKQFQEFDVRNIVQYFAQDKALDIKALDCHGLSAFYVAVLCCNKELVIALLDFLKGQIRLNEE